MEGILFVARNSFKPSLSASFKHQRILVKNMFSKWRSYRYAEFWMIGKGLIVKISNFSSCVNIIIQLFQFHIQNRCLNGIQPAVTAYHIMVITFTLPMIGNHFQFSCQRIIICKYCPAISITAKVFRGKKRSGTNGTDGAGFLNSSVCKCIITADGLCIVFNHIQCALLLSP